MNYLSADVVIFQKYVVTIKTKHVHIHYYETSMYLCGAYF